MKAKLLFIHALTPLHPGTGQGTGVIDLPIAREVATGIPYFPGSSLKGVLRDRCGNDANCTQLFGPKTGDSSQSNSHAGALQFTDQHLLLLPVRSLAGTFAWATSPFMLKRLKRTLENLGEKEIPTIPSPSSDEAMVTTNPKLSVSIGGDQKLFLEDLDFNAVQNEASSKWAEWLGKRLFPQEDESGEWRTMIQEKFVIMHDDRLSFLMETGTEIIARNVLDENKISQNLWYEEALPAESVLVGLITAQHVGTNGFDRDRALDSAVSLTRDITQLGGNATVGRGLCRLIA